MRRHVSRCLTYVLVSATLIGTATAQPTVRDHRTPQPQPDTRDMRRPPPPPTAEPRQAPPADREEGPAPRAGYVFIRGHWQWKAGKYDWVAGHWERERAAKKWIDGRWERKGDLWVWTAGRWVDSGIVAPNPTPRPTGPREAPPSPRDEKIAARAGYTWIRGRWDWRDSKWVWVDGRWERERAGKRWRDGRWEQRGDTWVYTDGDWADGGPVRPGGPREAPPTPREERQAARAGYVWAAGHWDWRNDKWDWIAGHWERERAGKRWRPARWEQRDGAWARIDGDWIDDAGPFPTEPGPGGPTPRPRPPREWRVERPAVSSYWPARGKAGTKVTIRGRNLPNDAMVLWSGNPLRAARVTEEQIVFEVPAGAISGAIGVRTNRGRELNVGGFEVVASYDAEAEARRIEEERRRAAEAAWIERQKALAKDRAARERAWREREEERERTREQRRAERLAAMRARWDRAFLADQETQDELTMHAQRVAELVRMREVAEIVNNGKLVVRIQVAQAREEERHDGRMESLKASFSARGGVR